MAKRILSCFSSDFEKMGKSELLEAIAESEGRSVVCETIGTIDPLLGDISNAELACSFGADMVILNLFDTDDPFIKGLPACEKKETIRTLKKLIGRPVGINLEPAEYDENDESLWAMKKGRIANAQNAMKALEMGVDMIVITGNPGIGVDNEGIVKAITQIKAAVGDKMILIAGKMHASGVKKEGASAILKMEEIDSFIKAGADIVLMPAPGTVPGIDLNWVKDRVDRIHELGGLAMTAMGTSQEGADTDTIKAIALLAKQSGTDIHHLGDSGLLGVALPENIMAYSTVIRGVRHTWHRMADSINR